MRVVYEAENLIDAHLVRGRLGSEGIEAFVRGEFLSGALGELPVSGLLSVCVAVADAERARALVEQWQAELGDAGVDADAAGPEPGDEPLALLQA